MKKDSFAIAIRKATLAPILSCVMVLMIRFCRTDIFLSNFHFVYTLLFLTIFPMLAYPLQRHIPKFRDQGRDGQRRLAMLFAFLGYLFECVANMSFSASAGLCLISGTYLLSGIILLVTNLFFHIKLSGHAAGACAASLFSVLFGIYWAIVPAAIIMILVYISSVQTQRHTLPQLLGGTLIPIVAVIALHFLYG